MVSKWCNATFFQIWWRNKLKKKTNVSRVRVRTFSANFHFWVNYSFNCEILIAISVWDCFYSKYYFSVQFLYKHTFLLCEKWYIEWWARFIQYVYINTCCTAVHRELRSKLMLQMLGGVQFSRVPDQPSCSCTVLQSLGWQGCLELVQRRGPHLHCSVEICPISSHPLAPWAISVQVQNLCLEDFTT